MKYGVDRRGEEKRLPYICYLRTSSLDIISGKDKILKLFSPTFSGGTHFFNGIRRNHRFDGETYAKFSSGENLSAKDGTGQDR